MYSAPGMWAWAYIERGPTFRISGFCLAGLKGLGEFVGRDELRTRDGVVRGDGTLPSGRLEAQYHGIGPIKQDRLLSEAETRDYQC